MNRCSLSDLPCLCLKDAQYMALVPNESFTQPLLIFWNQHKIQLLKLFSGSLRDQLSLTYFPLDDRNCISPRNLVLQYKSFKPIKKKKKLYAAHVHNKRQFILRRVYITNGSECFSICTLQYLFSLWQHLYLDPGADRNTLEITWNTKTHYFVYYVKQAIIQLIKKCRDRIKKNCNFDSLNDYFFSWYKVVLVGFHSGCFLRPIYSLNSAQTLM